MSAEIRGPRPDGEALRDLKVRVGVDLAIRLHHYRLLTGVTISRVVEEAVAEYYAERAGRGAGGEE